MAYPKHINLIKNVLEEHKAEEIQIINVKERSPFFTYYVIATCLNERQLNALSDEVEEKLEENGFDVKKNYDDCGKMVFDIKEQDVHAGGSGCGCSGIVFCGYILDQINQGKLNRVLFVGTGALMSPLNLLQGESIPCIAHAISVQRSLN